jgi:NADH-quinone oxidoreductase subunit G
MTETQQKTVTITVDGKTIAAEPGELLISAAERAGIFIPRFCWHKRMDPVGACRMCLVDVEGSPPIPGSDQRRPQTSCTTVVRDGMVVYTQFSSRQVNDAQKMILELLLINHPLDCPICDRGGECPLQDQTQDYGPAESRFIEPKRRFVKPVAISPLIKLDRERCILCYRCTRFCEELSGDVLIGVMDRGPEAFIFPFHTFDGNGHGADVRGPHAADIAETFDSYFSGNTVQICPVGALTSTEYRFKARPWDVHNVASTCNLCASGCAIQVGVRVQDGNVVRFSAGTNEDTNEEWLCDKGRYGNAYISSPDRLTHPYARKGNELAAVGWDEAFTIIADKLGPVVNGDAQAGVLVGESLCDEDAYAAQKFARLVLNTNNVDHRLSGGVSAGALPIPSLTYDDVLGSDLVVLVSLDTREEVPILFLRMRIAATKRGLRTAVVNSRAVGLSEYADARLAPFPGAEAATGAAVAGALGTTLAAGPQALAAAAGLHQEDVEAFARRLSAAERPVILLGPQACSTEVVRAWRGVADATGARWGWVPRRAGTNGALSSGAHPELLPGRRLVSDESARADVGGVWGAEIPSTPGLDGTTILERAASGDLAVLWVAGADVIGDSSDADLGRRALDGAGFVVVQDVQSSELLGYADLVLPAATFVEREGTLTDWEGRRQPVRAAMDPPGAARADYSIFSEAARRCGRPIGCRTITDVRTELDGLLSVEPVAPSDGGPVRAEAPRGHADYPLRLLTYRLLYDDGSRIRHTDGVRKVTLQPFVEVHPSDAQRSGIEDGLDVTVTSAHGSVVARALVTDNIREGVVFVPWRQWGVSAQALVATNDHYPSVRVEPN